MICGLANGFFLKKKISLFSSSRTEYVNIMNAWTHATSAVSTREVGDEEHFWVFVSHLRSLLLLWMSVTLYFCLWLSPFPLLCPHQHFHNSCKEIVDKAFIIWANKAWHGSSLSLSLSLFPSTPPSLSWSIFLSCLPSLKKLDLIRACSSNYLGGWVRGIPFQDMSGYRMFKASMVKTKKQTNKK